MTQHKTALVTGASRGIGRGIALELAAKGYHIAGTGRHFDPDDTNRGLFKVKQEVEEKGGRFLPLQADIADLSGHAEVLESVWKTYGRLDVLVNNAGIAPPERLDILKTTPDNFDRVMDVNMRGPFFFTQRAIPYLRRTREENEDAQPCVIFITSFSAEVSSVNRAEYCMSKAGLSQAARVLAHRLAGEGVNVYEIRPGIILTDMTRPVKDKYDRMIDAGLIPQKRWGYPGDVGKAAAALAEGALDYATGQIIEISGGMDIRRL